MEHTSLETLEQRIHGATQAVEVGARYYHYRNPSQLYEVIAIGLDEASEQPTIIYKSLYGNGLVWVRPLSSWLAAVEHNGATTTRFQKAKKTCC